MIFEALIVDDEAPARVELINQLERTGRVHVVSEAVCLQEGIAKMKQGGFDVVFVDHNIAGAGTTMLPDVLPELPKVPLFIYMTAYSDVMDDPFGMEPLGFLVKPVEDAKLDEIIELIEESYWSGVARRVTAQNEAAQHKDTEMPETAETPGATETPEIAKTPKIAETPKAAETPSIGAGQSGVVRS